MPVLRGWSALDGSRESTRDDIYAQPQKYSYYAGGERKRQAVNEFIRTTDVFDGVFDFDEALQDPDDPKRLLSEYDSGDNLHPSDAGYEQMAQTIDLDVLSHGEQNTGKMEAPTSIGGIEIGA